MKPEQRLRYADRIDRVVAHLERAPSDELPPLSELARIASLSEYHFHRVFRLMTGETVGDFVRRIRLARSLPTLAAGASVTVAAAESGYGTPQSYARALRASVGSTPTAGRYDLRALESALRRARPGTRGTEPIPAMTIDVVSVDPFRLLAIRNVGAYEELNAAYVKLFGLVMAQVEPADIAGIYGIRLDDPQSVGPQQCRSVCALAVGGAGAAQGELEEISLGGSRCVRIHHRGSYDLLAGSLDALYAYAMTNLDEELGASAPYIHHWDDPDEVPEAELRSDVYLPLTG